MSGPAGLEVRRVGPEAAADVLAVVRAAFATRPPLDPPADALGETLESLREALARGAGLLALQDGGSVGALVFDPVGDAVFLRRFGVLPGARRHGVAAALVEQALATVPGFGVAEVAVLARQELPDGVSFWEGQGFRRSRVQAPYVELVRPLPRGYDVSDGDAMRDLGRRLAGVLRAGDLLVLAGELGAGKTTFTQGIGAGLGVRGEVTSPTFVIARVHPSLDAGPALVHADAYRLGGIAELDDLDLDASLDQAVTVVEWGTGLAEGLAEERLEVGIERSFADPEHDLDPRRVELVPVGLRWRGVAWPPAG